MVNSGYDIKIKAKYKIKLFDFKEIGEAGENHGLPITKPTVYENLSCEDKALVKEGGYDLLKCIYQNEAYPTLERHYMHEGHYYRAGEKDMLIAITNMGVHALDITPSYADQPLWRRLHALPLTSMDEFRIAGKNVMVIGGSTIMVTFDGENIVTKPEGQRPPCKIRDIVNHYGRMFVTDMEDRYKIHFSDESDPFNYNVSAYEGGHLTVEIGSGKIIKLLSMGEYLYIFCERGVHKLRAYGEQSEFNLKRVETFTGDIVEKSITMCGSRILFWSTAGFMEFDGYNCKKLHDSLHKVAEAYKGGFHDVTSCYCKEKYYMTAAGDSGNKCIIIDLGKDCYSVIDIGEYRGVAAVNRGSDMVVMYPKISLATVPWSPIGYLTDKVVVRYGKIGVEGVDMGLPCSLKNVKAIDISQPIDGWLTVSGEGQSQRINLTKIGCIPVNVSGHRLKFVLELRSGKAYSPTVKIEVSTFGRSG